MGNRWEQDNQEFGIQIFNQNRQIAGYFEPFYELLIMYIARQNDDGQIDMKYSQVSYQIIEYFIVNSAWNKIFIIRAAPNKK